MKFWIFVPWFLLLALLYFAQGRLWHGAVQIEWMFFLIMFIIRDCDDIRALIYTCALSLGLDFVLQSHAVKGLDAMVLLLLVQGALWLKKQVMPTLLPIFLSAGCGVFYVLHHYLTNGLKLALKLEMEPLGPRQVLVTALVHIVLFAMVLAVTRLRSRPKT